MSTMSITPLTDERGKGLTLDLLDEPNPGSVVLTHGEHGTAWQRHFDDGMWYRSGGGRPRDWLYLSVQRNLVLVYSARERFGKVDLR